MESKALYQLLMFEGLKLRLLPHPQSPPAPLALSPKTLCKPDRPALGASECLCTLTTSPSTHHYSSHTLTPSYPHTLTPSHPHTITHHTPSHPHTITHHPPSHPHPLHSWPPQVRSSSAPGPREEAEAGGGQEEVSPHKGDG